MNGSMHADNYVRTLAREQPRRYSFSASNKDDMEKWQIEFRKELSRVLGLDLIRERGIADLNPECLSSTVLDGHVREEWRITSEQGYRVPFYLLKPLDCNSPRPLVITPHGHGKYGKDTYVGIFHGDDDHRSMKEGERDIALQAVRAGYIAIAPDQRGFAQTRLTKDIEADKLSSCRTMQMHALLFGRTLIGERVWDIKRIIDFAQTCPFIDSNRIAITGNSGGGTVSLFAAAIDIRITIAIPGSYFCTFEDSIGSINHCECNYIPGIMTLGEMYDIAGLIAPRPLLIVAGREDTIFPIEAVKKAYSKVLKMYEILGAEDRCELYIGDGGHRYYKERVWDFISKWF